MSLRNDPGRLSLETLLTGTALWLALVYLMQEGAAAAGPIHEQSGNDQPRAGDAGPTDMAPQPIPGRSGGVERSPVDPEALTAKGEPPASGTAAADGAGSEAGRGGWPLAGSSGMAAAGPRGQAQQGTAPGSGSLAAGSVPLPLGATPAGSSGGRTTEQGGGSDRPGAMEPTPADVAAMPLAAESPAGAPAGGPIPAVVPVVPGLRVLVRSEDSLVSRSVEGPAQAGYRQSLGAISDAVIDLRDTPAPEIRVGSERELHLLALSVLNDAGLVLESSNTGLQRTSLLLGSEVNDIRLMVSDAIDLGLVAGGLARGQIRQSLVGLLDSQLQDAGGGGTLDISTLARVRLMASEAASQRQLDVDLLAEAMQNSTVLLGHGDDRVSIDSGFRRSDGSGTDLILDSPSPGSAEAGDSLRLRARALGLVNSRLDVGGGDDQVSITTGLERPWSAGLERIALLESAVQLGDGDDLLSVQGAVIGSRIDPGGGSNAVRVDGPVRDLLLNLSADSTTAVELGGTDDALAVVLPEDARAAVALDLGSGDDRIRLPGAGLEGSLDGGAGLDSLRLTSSAMPAPLAISLDGSGAGMSGRLGFTGIETLSLGGGDDRVSIGINGTLLGMLEAGGGLDRLDYTSWQVPVHVDLGLGLASGILGGIGGFEAVAGGSGDDWLIAAGDTVELDGGDGNDQFELDLSAAPTAGTSQTPSWFVQGGGGRDRFVLAGMETLRRIASAGDRPLPVLADLDRSAATDGGIGLTDRLAWRRGGILVEKGNEELVVDLTPAGLEGIGQPRLLPIAPLDQLVRGMASRSSGTEQLAIATGDHSSRLVLLGSDRSITAIAELPGLRPANTVADTLPSSGALR